ncbi:MAG: 4Fe-4S binding protein [Deltaproteobacteria bacterium]|nr:4Fe-4S binding protein [Deltaproteobacteria bacterium]
MRYIEDVVTLELDVDRCNGCRMCLRVCPHAVFQMSGKRAVLHDRGACMECGACARNCEQGAIRVRAGVGCAAGVLAGLVGGSEPSCGCSVDKPSGCC